jgi:hypothetical protein
VAALWGGWDMTRRRIPAKLGAMAASLLLAAGLALGRGMAAAAEINPELDSPSPMKTNLERTEGQRVKVRLVGGQELEGVVTKVGATAVHQRNLTGMDFCDAVALLDHVSAAIIRARGCRGAGLPRPPAGTLPVGPRPAVA